MVSHCIHSQNIEWDPLRRLASSQGRSRPLDDEPDHPISPARAGSKRRLITPLPSTTASSSKTAKRSRVDPDEPDSLLASVLRLKLAEPRSNAGSIKQRKEFVKKLEGGQEFSTEVTVSLQKQKLPGQAFRHKIRVATPERSTFTSAKDPANDDDVEGLTTLLHLEHSGFAFLLHLSESGEVKLETSLSFSRSSDFLFLVVKIYVLPPFFSLTTRSYEKDSAILLLFTPQYPLAEGGSYDGTIDVEFFYRCLKRAPITRGGYFVQGAKKDGHKGKNRMEVEMEMKETLEEVEARIRREKKGKGKARDQAPEREEAVPEEEDDIVRPPGLKADLMPFQSRTVRWLLGREGKVVLPSPPREDVEMNGSGEGQDVRMKDQDRDEEDEDEDEEDDLYAEADDHPLHILGDVSPEIQREIRRGPLWEEVPLHILDDEEEVKDVKLVWLNRNSGLVSFEDPAEVLGENEIGGEASRVIGDAESDNSELDGTSMFYAVAGCGLLADEMGLGKSEFDLLE